MPQSIIYRTPENRSILISSDGNVYEDHKCRLTTDENGVELQGYVIRNFDMSSSTKLDDTSKFPDMIYIGFGQFWSIKINGRVKFNEGNSHFYRKRK